MIQRECPQCGNELVRAKRSDQQPGSIAAPVVSRGWRCGVCGGEFTTEQIRHSKRTKSAAIEHP
jgi:hypothetical protein